MNRRSFIGKSLAALCGLFVASPIVKSTGNAIRDAEPGTILTLKSGKHLFFCDGVMYKFYHLSGNIDQLGGLNKNEQSS